MSVLFLLIAKTLQHSRVVKNKTQVSLFTSRFCPPLCFHACLSAWQDVQFKLFFSFLQSIGLASAFAFKWPLVLSSVFAAMETCGAAGGSLFNFTCLLPNPMDAFVVRLLLLAALPPGIALVTALTWTVLGKLRPSLVSTAIP